MNSGDSLVAVGSDAFPLADREGTPSNLPRCEVALRWVVAATMVAILWKVAAFAVMLRTYFVIPLNQRFFPSWLASPWVILAAYGLAITALATLLWVRSLAWRKAASWVAIFSLSVLCLHQGSYNDMTFVTAWWTMLWSLWLVHRIGVDEDKVLVRKAARLSRGIVSVILLGGAAGKWTESYWSGQVLYEIYFVDRDFWVFNGLRRMLSEDSLRELAKWYSRKVIVIETACGLGLWALPPRTAATIGVVVMMSIACFSNFNLFSVLLSLVGLAAVGWLVPRFDKSHSRSINPAPGDESKCFGIVRGCRDPVA